MTPVNLKKPKAAASTPRHLIFLHIPKTGGSTLTRLLERVYKGQVNFNTAANDVVGENIVRLCNMPQNERDGITLVRGHMAYGLHRFFSGESVYLTMLREPVARVRSLYYFQQVFQPNAPYRRGRALEELLEAPDGAEYRNAQVRYLAGNPECDSIFGHADCRESDLHLARHNLMATGMLAGMFEQYDASLLWFRDNLGWSQPFYCRVNVTAHKPPLTEQQVRLIKKHNELDIELYAEFHEHFQRVLRRHRRLFILPVAWFKFRNRRARGRLE